MAYLLFTTKWGSLFFLEIVFDFTAATDISPIGASHDGDTPMEDVAAAVSQLFVFF